MLVVACVVVAVGLLLCVPVRVAFHVEAVAPPTGQARIRWLFGLVRFSIRVPSNAGTGSRAGGRGGPRRRGAGRQRRRGPSRLLRMLRHEEFRGRASRFVADLVRAAHLRQLRLWVRLGLGDPADTGRLWAFAGLLSAGARSLRGADVSIVPDFLDATLELRAEGRARLVPARLLALALAFVLSPPCVRAWRAVGGELA